MQQELARRRQQQQLYAQLHAHQKALPQQALQLSPPTTSQGRPLSRTQRILQEQLFQLPPRIGRVQATSSPAASPSLPPQPQQPQFTYPAESMAAAVAIAGAHSRKPVVSSRAFSSPILPSQPLQQAKCTDKAGSKAAAAAIAGAHKPKPIMSFSRFLAMDSQLLSYRAEGPE